MSHYDDYYYEEEKKRREAREELKKGLEDKFNAMTRDEKIDWLLEYSIEKYIHERIFGR